MLKIVTTAEELDTALKAGVCYVSGPISGVENYRGNFREAEELLNGLECPVINPAHMPEGLAYEAYFPTCFAQVDVSASICLLDGYRKSMGAAREVKRAQQSSSSYWLFTYRQLLYWTQGLSNRKSDIAWETKNMKKWVTHLNPPRTETQKENEKVKHLLCAYLYCQHQIDAATDEIEVLDSRRKRITIQFRDVHGYNGGEYEAAVIDSINKLERTIRQSVQRLDTERRKVEFWIDSLDDYRERNVLTMRYINGMRYEEIAKKMIYEVRTVKRIHGRSINKIRENLRNIKDVPKCHSKT